MQFSDVHTLYREIRKAGLLNPSNFKGHIFKKLFRWSYQPLRFSASFSADK